MAKRRRLTPALFWYHIFIVALAWNSAIQKSFEFFETKSDELKAKYSYAFAITAIAIVLGFFIMYFIDGDKW